MNAIHDKCRPKHQVLVLKCYPKTTKGAVDVAPNSSELSYLLFYATSRRSKIQKIGSFLEKKTASDVWRMRIGNVQVTLGILAALVEKSPKEAALIAPCVLKILDLILRSDDITMVESSLPTFEAFCQHHDASSLFGDGAYLQSYQSVVQSYAQLASPRHVPAKGPLSKPLQFRWRKAGLEAIKHVAASDALSSVAGRQIDVIVPMILENIWTDDDVFLDTILEKAELDGKRDPEKLARRRSSVNTVRTAELAGDTNPVALSGSALDVDRLAEEEIGAFAIQCLKKIFVVPNTIQIYGATGALVKFVSNRVAEGDIVVVSEKSSGHDSGWAIQLFDIVSRWTPVQHRYVIFLATLDALNKTPMREENLLQHMTLTAMIQSLLRSDINLIGLSVMDALLGLIGQIKKLFQMRRGSSHGGSQSEDRGDVEQHENGCRLQRDELLARLEDCTSDLANHVYYADQVSDMISALFSRVRHSRSASVTSLTHGGEKTEVGAGAGPWPRADGAALPPAFDVAGGHSLQETYFSHSSGRLSALKIVKAILLLASSKAGHNGNLDLSRTRVPIQVWEGTQWLLRDPDGNVRKAYVDALSTWLDREVNYRDLRASDETVISHRTARNGRDISGGGGGGGGGGGSTRRAISAAPARERQPRARRCQFLPLLHVAIYDSALEFVEYDNDITLLHSLLTKLVFKLGVNAVRFGIPMVYRLQEDIQELEQPIHKVRIASLTHGYFWALAEKFDFEGSMVGRAVYKEIVRRKNKGFWVEGVNVPAPEPAQVGTPGQPRPHPSWDLSSLETEAILPFDDRPSLVECIATSYRETYLSPPTSPAPTSPNRNHNGTVLGTTSGAGLEARDDGRTELPPQFREHMLADWSRDSVLAAISAAGKAESLNGTTGTTQNRLTITTAGGGGSGVFHGVNGHGPFPSYQSPHNARPHTSQTFGARSLASVFKQRKSSVGGRVSTPESASSRAGVASVEQLKMMLSGTASPQTAGRMGADDDSDESLLSCDYSMSDMGPGNAAASQTDGPPGTTGELVARSVSGSAAAAAAASQRERRSSNAGVRDDGAPAPSQREESDEYVPPVPPLPSLTSFPSKMGMQPLDYSPNGKRNLSSRGGDGFRSQSMRFGEEGGSRSMNLQDLLRSIDSRPGEGTLGNISKPPY
ncbi:hypothetical protein E4U42_005340 [Claviceps africana]|uniref:Protein EFR3 n=1 Tax=Claviceps africana TaxID=83212 RepID=A0A8K0J6R2_9HYPO|nr:hypothetical protein E4U42_005340 [Claviceps africana]